MDSNNTLVAGLNTTVAVDSNGRTIHRAGGKFKLKLSYATMTILAIGFGVSALFTWCAVFYFLCRRNNRNKNNKK